MQRAIRHAHALEPRIQRKGTMQATLPNPAVLMAQDAVAVVATARHSGEPLLPDEARYVAARGMQPRRAAEFLHCNFALVINNTRLL